MLIYKRIILFIALISFLLSCKNSSNTNIDIKSNHENVKYGNIKQENIKYENIKNEIEILENTLNENIILEHVIFEESTIEDLEINIKDKEYSDEFWGDIDWKPIISKFAIGTSVIIITGVLSITTIGTYEWVSIFSFKRTLEGALIGVSTGMALNSISQIILNGGKVDGWQKYALEGAADGYMYGAINGAIFGTKESYKEFNSRKQYVKSRPSYRKGVVEEVWENAKKGQDGKVRDHNTGEVIDWKPGMPRDGVWDMGHRSGQEYREMIDRFRRGKITKKEFFDWYNDPKNYYPELPSNNRSHRFEAK